MGLKKEHPRYNVLSVRISDDLRKCLDHALAGQSVQEYLHAALEAKLIADRQHRIDEITRRGAVCQRQPR